MIVQVCYADDVYAKAQKWNIRFAKWFGGCKEVYAYNREKLPEDFKEKHKRILGFKRGGGYWIWKSFIIQESLKKLQFGDYLFYCDSGVLLIKHLKKLIKVMEEDKQDVMVFEVCGRTESEFTKRDVFVAMDCDSEEYLGTQRMSTCVLIKKTEATVKFIDEYVKYSQCGSIITDEENVLGKPNYDDFIENRHDQSILSLLSKKWGYVAYRDPSQWGTLQKIKYKANSFKYSNEYETFERSKRFPQMTIHHRYKKINLHNILAYYKNYLKLYLKVKKNPEKQI